MRFYLSFFCRFWLCLVVLTMTANVLRVAAVPGFAKREVSTEHRIFKCNEMCLTKNKSRHRCNTLLWAVHSGYEMFVSGSITIASTNRPFERRLAILLCLLIFLEPRKAMDFEP